MASGVMVTGAVAGCTDPEKPLCETHPNHPDCTGVPPQSTWYMEDLKDWDNQVDLLNKIDAVGITVPNIGGDVGDVVLKETSLGKELTFAVAMTDSNAAANKAADYGQKLLGLSRGFTKIDERTNSIPQSHAILRRLQFDVYKVDHSGVTYYVEVGGGVFSGRDLGHDHGIPSGYGVKILSYDNAAVTQESWATGMKYRDSRDYLDEPKSTGIQKNLIIPIQFTDYTFDNPFGLTGSLPANTEDVMMNYLDIVENGAAGTTTFESVASYYDKSSKGKLQVESKFADLGTYPSDHPTKPNQKIKAYQVMNKPWKEEVGGQTIYHPAAPASTVDFIRRAKEIGEEGHVVFELLDQVVAYLIDEVYGGDTAAYAEAMKEFDVNGDMIIDSVRFVYPYCSRPSVNDTSLPADLRGTADDVFWAYVHHNYFMSGKPTEYPLPYTFTFLSWDMMFEGGYWDNGTYMGAYTEAQITSGTAKPNPYTWIHEHGHVLSMPDYYNYDNQSISLLGGTDMMDHNVGDHNGYSKMGYEWIMPKVVRYPTTLTLNNYQDTSDIIVIPAKNGWRNTVLDEYIMLELYTPTGLNKKDAEEPLGNTNFHQMFTTTGVKISHVDSRLGIGTHVNGKWVFQRFVDRIVSTPVGSSIRVATDNTPSRSVKFKNYNLDSTAPDANAKLIELLSPDGKTYTGQANNSRLYTPTTTMYATTNSSGNPVAFKDYYFNNGELFGWTIELTNMSDGSVTVTIK